MTSRRIENPYLYQPQIEDPTYIGKMSSTWEIDSSGGAIVGSGTYEGASSYQPVAIDLELDAAAGKDAANTAFLSPVMGNVIGDALTKTGNYLGGLVGWYSITGAKGTHFPAGAVLGGIADGVTEADGAFVAIIDGDSAVTKAEAAFKARARNSTAGSGFNYGLDLYDPAADGFSALAILKADLRLSNEVCTITLAGVPVDGVAGTGAGFAGPGSQAVDVTNSNMYINANTKASPTWKLVTRAA